LVDPNTSDMKPKKEHTEHEKHDESGATVERTSFYDPDTGTHGEKIKVEKDPNWLSADPSTYPRKDFCPNYPSHRMQQLK